MKKIFTALFLLVLVFAVCACSEKAPNSATTAKITEGGATSALTSDEAAVTTLPAVTEAPIQYANNTYANFIKACFEEPCDTELNTSESEIKIISALKQAKGDDRLSPLEFGKAVILDSSDIFTTGNEEYSYILYRIQHGNPVRICNVGLEKSADGKTLTVTETIVDTSGELNQAMVVRYHVLIKVERSVIEDVETVSLNVNSKKIERLEKADTSYGALVDNVFVGGRHLNELPSQRSQIEISCAQMVSYTDDYIKTIGEITIEKGDAVLLSPSELYNTDDDKYMYVLAYDKYTHSPNYLYSVELEKSDDGKALGLNLIYKEVNELTEDTDGKHYFVLIKVEKSLVEGAESATLEVKYQKVR